MRSAPRVSALAAMVRLLVVALMLPLPAPARAQSVPADSTAAAAPAGSTTGVAPAADLAGPLAEARDLVRNGDYDRAIELLRGAVARGAEGSADQREAYLMLIKTYVFLGNDYKFRPQGREASSLNYRAARELIAEMLATPAYRQTQPAPASDYPPEMIAFFGDVRSRLFGAFRVAGLEPADAVVTLDGDTLRPVAGESGLGVADLPVGSHVVVVRAAGHQPLDEAITISPNVTLERGYRLEKRRGPGYYATRVVGVLGLVGGAIALIAGNKNGGASTPQPLPGAPPPPAN